MAHFQLTNAREIAASMRKHADAVIPAVRVEWKKIGRDLVKASKSHRFQNETHFLEKSVKAEVTPDGKTMTFYADLGIAPYARRIHNGWGTWNPDAFMERPFNEMAPQMGERLQAAIAKAVGAE